MCHDWIWDTLSKTFKVIQHSEFRNTFTKHESCDVRVVKELDLKSNGVSPRRFEPYSQRLFMRDLFMLMFTSCYNLFTDMLLKAFQVIQLTEFRKEFNITASCDGREVKALDSKSNGVSPRRFEPYSQRLIMMDFFMLMLTSCHNWFTDTLLKAFRVIQLSEFRK